MTHLTLMTLGFAEEFFRRCIEAEAVTEEERTNILSQMIKEGKAQYMGASPYGKATVARKIGEKFGALYIGKKVKPSKTVTPKERS